MGHVGNELGSIQDNILDVPPQQRPCKLSGTDCMPGTVLLQVKLSGKLFEGAVISSLS